MTFADLNTFALAFSSRKRFLKFLQQSDNELLVSESKKMGVIDFVSEIKRVETTLILKN